MQQTLEKKHYEHERQPNHALSDKWWRPPKNLENTIKTDLSISVEDLLEYQSSWKTTLLHLLVHEFKIPLDDESHVTKKIFQFIEKIQDQNEEENAINKETKTFQYLIENLVEKQKSAIRSVKTRLQTESDTSIQFRFPVKKNLNRKLKINIAPDKKSVIITLQGQTPVFGKDGFITEIANLKKNPGQKLSDNLMAWEYMNTYPAVQKKELLFSITPAKKGHDGVNYKGDLLPVEKTETPTIKFPKNTLEMKVDKENQTVCFEAKKEGIAHITRNPIGVIQSISITKTLRLQDVDFKGGGNIKVPITLHCKNIKDRFCVDIKKLTAQEIDGGTAKCQESANIKRISTGSIVQAQTINAEKINRPEKITAQDTLSIDQSVVDAKNVQTNHLKMNTKAQTQILNSRFECNDVATENGFFQGKNIFILGKKIFDQKKDVEQQKESTTKKIHKLIEQGQEQSRLIFENIKKLLDHLPQKERRDLNQKIREKSLALTVEEWQHFSIDKKTMQFIRIVAKTKNEHTQNRKKIIKLQKELENLDIELEALGNAIKNISFEITNSSLGPNSQIIFYLADGKEQKFYIDPLSKMDKTGKTKTYRTFIKHLKVKIIESAENTHELTIIRKESNSEIKKILPLGKK